MGHEAQEEVERRQVLEDHEHQMQHDDHDDRPSNHLLGQDSVLFHPLGQVEQTTRCRKKRRFNRRFLGINLLYSHQLIEISIYMRIMTGGGTKTDGCEREEDKVGRPHEQVREQKHLQRLRCNSAPPLYTMKTIRSRCAVRRHVFYLLTWRNYFCFLA
jgi:hypothetical protein